MYSNMYSGNFKLIHIVGYFSNDQESENQNILTQLHAVSYIVIEYLIYRPT